MRLSNLAKALPDRPLHPPLTDANIGIYTGATVAAGARPGPQGLGP